MSGKRYTEEFKIEAVKQVTDRGYKIVEVAQRLGISSKSLGDWIKKYGDAGSPHQTITSQQEELRRLKAELRRVVEERNILKEAVLDSTGHCNTITDAQPPVRSDRDAAKTSYEGGLKTGHLEPMAGGPVAQ